VGFVVIPDCAPCCEHHFNSYVLLDSASGPLRCWAAGGGGGGGGGAISSGLEPAVRACVVIQLQLLGFLGGPDTGTAPGRSLGISPPTSHDCLNRLAEQVSFQAGGIVRAGWAWSCRSCQQRRWGARGAGSSRRRRWVVFEPGAAHSQPSRGRRCSTARAVEASSVSLGLARPLNHTARRPLATARAGASTSPSLARRKRAAPGRVHHSSSERRKSASGAPTGRGRPPDQKLLRSRLRAAPALDRPGGRCGRARPSAPARSARAWGSRATGRLLSIFENGAAPPRYQSTSWSVCGLSGALPAKQLAQAVAAELGKAQGRPAEGLGGLGFPAPPAGALPGSATRFFLADRQPQTLVIGSRSG